MSLEADLTFRALLCAVDDYGRFEADPLMLKAALFPRRTNVSPEDVAGWVAELDREGCVQLYTVAGVALLCLTGWETHRGNARRSGKPKYPEPPAVKRTENLPGDSRKSGSVPEIREMRGNPSENRESGIENRESGIVCREASRKSAPASAPTPTDAPESASPPPEAGSRKRRGRTRSPTIPPPDDFTPEERAALESWCADAFPPMLGDLPRIAAKILDWGRSKGEWRADWPATVRNAVREEAERRGLTRATAQVARQPPEPALRAVETPQERGGRSGGGVVPLFGGQP